MGDRRCARALETGLSEAEETPRASSCKRNEVGHLRLKTCVWSEREARGFLESVCGRKERMQTAAVN